VSDNGPGVDPERAEIIFHPFVSSKPANGGRGLGLYISRELAAYHDWKLAMDAAAPVVRAGRLNTFLLDVSGGKQ
jgi:signal transduction histidine kinase